MQLPFLYIQLIPKRVLIQSYPKLKPTRKRKSVIPSRFVRQLLLMLCLLIAAGCAITRYQPEYNQPGKNVVWWPTAQVLVNKMLDMAKVTPEDFVIDLGSGDGRTVISAAKRGARALGIEYNPDMVALSKRNAAKENVGERAQFVEGDLFESDFSQATVITMFLSEPINLKLRPRILNLKPGTRVLSNSFTMGEWKPDETVTVQHGRYCTALLWIVPAKVEGTWKLSEGELTFTQLFQTFSGTFKSGSNTVAIKNGQLSGDLISFSIGDANYTGRVNGDTMEGIYESGGITAKWKTTKAGKVL
jgi:SAM-dependent methyltransferase